MECTARSWAADPRRAAAQSVAPESPGDSRVAQPRFLVGRMAQLTVDDAHPGLDPAFLCPRDGAGRSASLRPERVVVTRQHCSWLAGVVEPGAVRHFLPHPPLLVAQVLAKQPEQAVVAVRAAARDVALGDEVTPVHV